MVRRKVNGYDVFELKRPEGAFLVRRFCEVEEQIEIGMQALNEYIFRPYRTNLDGTNGLYDQGFEYKDEVIVEPTYEESDEMAEEKLQGKVEKKKE